MKQLVSITLLFFTGIAWTQVEIEWFPEDSLILNEYPSHEYFVQLSRGIGPDEQWRGGYKDGKLCFYDEYLADFFGDEPPVSIDSLRDLLDCRVGGGDYHFLKAHNGWYLGTNRGEWGGNLFKLSSDLKKCTLVCRPFVNQLYQFNNRVFVVEGLSHLGSSGGFILEIHPDLTVDTLMRLDETPRFLTFNPSESGFLLTDSKIYAVNLAMDTVTMYSNDQWPYLYPSNIFLQDDKLYVTMAGGIAVYFIHSKELKWLTRE